MNNMPVRVRLAAMIGLAVILLLAAGCVRFGEKYDEQLQIHFLDAGQADAALLQYKGKYMLIDTGDVDSRPALLKMLKDKGVKELDVVLLSHPHGDHMGGMNALFQHFSIKRVCDNGQVVHTAMYKNYVKNIAERHIPYTVLKQGDKIVFADDVVCHVFWPTAQDGLDYGMSESSRTNNQSVVCKVVFGDFSVLFTGDIQYEGETAILRTVHHSQLKSTIVKVGHHGSQTSSGLAFIQAVRPVAAVISCGAGNSYGFPYQKVLDSLQKYGATIYRTDRNGMISVRSDGKTYTVAKER